MGGLHRVVISAREAIVVEAGFADGDHARGAGQRAQGNESPGFSFGGGAGVNANGGVNGGVRLGKRHCAAAAFERGADGDDARHTRLRGPLDEGVDFSLKFGKIEMGMGVDEHGGGSL